MDAAGPSGARPAGSLGPRLAGRLTAELISRSPQYMNCVRNYEIDLRGNKIGAIENLGVTQNQFDSIDLSDNAIVRLEGFPRLPRLTVLLLNNNRIAKIARNLEAAIQNLETLVLTNNKIADVKDLDPLSTLPRLTTLCLIGNPVSLKKEYRLYAISRCPHLKILDWKKVKQKEREEATKVYGTLEQQQQAGNTFEPGEGLPEPAAAADGADGEEAAADGAEDAAAADAAKPTAAPTAEQLTAIKAAVANAQTLEDAWRLEQSLKAGDMPSALERKEQQQQQQQQDGSAAMEEG